MASIKLESVVLDYPVSSSFKGFLSSKLPLNTIGGKIQKQKNNLVIVRALDHLSMEFQAGDCVGLIGHNGSGKSSLLRVLAGVFEPTHGRLEVEGGTSALLGLGLGMNTEATGYQNIELNATLHGYQGREIAAKVKDIEDFTELREYLDMPIRTYSSGMRVRLSFAMATSFSKEILLVDEVMGAGDASFMEKAKKRMEKHLLESDLLVMANHSTSVIKKFCNKVLWLKAGKKMFFGPVDEGVSLYQESIKAHKEKKA